VEELAELERQLIEAAQDKLHKKIEAGDFNGDIQENMLLVLFSINRRVGRICGNPMIKLGDFFQKYPKAALTAGMILWILLGASSLLAITTFFNALGLTIQTIP